MNEIEWSAYSQGFRDATHDVAYGKFTSKEDLDAIRHLPSHYISGYVASRDLTARIIANTIKAVKGSD